MSQSQLLVRHGEQASVWSVTDGIAVQLPELSGLDALYVISSNDGNHIALAQANQVVVVRLQDNHKITLEAAGANMLQFSPTAEYLVTHANWKSEVREKNVQLWSLSTCECVMSLTRKSVQREQWPVLHWGPRSRLVAYQGKECIMLYGLGPNGEQQQRRIPFKQVSQFTLSPADPPMISTYVAATQNLPATVCLYDRGMGDTEPQPVARKSFFRAQDVRFLWNSTGSALLAFATSDYDPTNKTYYGDQKLYYLAANGSKDLQVACPKEGPIHDVQWAPTGSHFVLISGVMPPRAALYDAQAKQLASFPPGPYNTVRWNPQGRMFVLAGYGALPGDVWTYERKDDDTCSCVGHVRAPAVSVSWSPCGRFLLMATTAPRLRVDNQFQVYTYYGKRVHHEVLDPLYEATWVPRPPGTFPDRPASPGRAEAVQGLALGQTGGANGGASAKPKAYIPPHLRKMGVTSMEGRGNFSLGFHEDNSAPSTKASNDASNQKPQSKSAKKHARRRQKAKSQPQGN